MVRKCDSPVKMMHRCFNMMEVVVRAGNFPREEIPGRTQENGRIRMIGDQALLFGAFTLGIWQ